MPRPFSFRLRTLAVIGVSAAALSTPTAAGAAAPAVYSARTGAQVVLTSSAGVSTTVETLSLPRGSWTVTSNATAIDFAAGDFVRCALYDNGTIFSGGSTTYLENTVADLSNAGVLKTTATTAVTLACSHDHASATGQFYIDPGATLTAVVAGGPIKGLSTAAAAPAVVQQRTSAQVPLNDASAATVLSIKLGAGTWAVQTSFSAVNFGGFDYVDCNLESGVSVLGQQRVVVGDSDAIVSNLELQGFERSSKIATVNVVCQSNETNNVYIDPGATITATLIPNPSNLTNGFEGGVELPDTGGVATQVFHRKIPAGAWRVSSTITTYLATGSGGIGGGSDFVRCGLLAGKKAIDGGATVLINAVDSGGDPGNDEQEIVNSGTFTATKPWTLSVSCSHDHTISTGSHWVAIASSPALAIQQGPIKATVT